MDFHVVTLAVRRRRLSLSNFFMHVFLFVFAVAVVFFTSYKPPNLRMFVEMMFRRASASADMMTCDIAEQSAPPRRLTTECCCCYKITNLSTENIFGESFCCVVVTFFRSPVYMCIRSSIVIPPIRIQPCHSVK